MLHRKGNCFSDSICSLPAKAEPTGMTLWNSVNETVEQHAVGSALTSAWSFEHAPVWPADYCNVF